METASPNGAEFATGPTELQNVSVRWCAVQCRSSRCFMTIAVAVAVAVADNLKKGLELEGMMGLEF